MEKRDKPLIPFIIFSMLAHAGGAAGFFSMSADYKGAVKNGIIVEVIGRGLGQGAGKIIEADTRQYEMPVQPRPGASAEGMVEFPENKEVSIIGEKSAVALIENSAGSFDTGDAGTYSDGGVFAGSATPAVGNGDGVEAGGYAADIIEAIRRNAYYPVIARKQGLEGRVVADFFVTQDGTITDLKVESSGFGALDIAARKIIEMSSPLPPLPRLPYRTSGGSRVKVPLVFSLKDHR